MPTDSQHCNFGMQVWSRAFGLREDGGSSGSTVGTELLPRMWGRFPNETSLFKKKQISYINKACKL